MSRKILFLIIAVGVIVLLILLSKNISRDRLENVDQFRIYYREIDEAILNDMGNYDLVIVEGLHFNQQDVEKVKEKDSTIILGYLSIMEIGNWDEGIIKELYSSDYLNIDGERVKNNKNYHGDISSEHYQDVLIDSIEKRALSKGMDGVFLDTVGSLDDYKGDVKLYNRLLSGYEQFLIKLRERYSDIYIIQNRGFETLSRVSSDYVDGVLWEDFNVLTIEKWRSVQEWVELLQRLEKDKNLIIFTESYGNEKDNILFTKKMGWVHYQNNSNQHSDWFKMMDYDKE